MVRSQIVLDEELAELLRACAERTGDSISSIVRDALRAYFSSEPPDTSWIGGLRPTKQVDHRWETIEAAIEHGWAKEARR